MIGRRELVLSALGATLVSAISPARAATRRLAVLTSYPPEVISRYVDAFSAARPGTRVDVVWHSGDDARDYLLGAGRGKIDVYWSPAVPTFHALKRDGALRPLSLDLTGLPGHIGTQMLSDPDGCFEATEIAGYGLALNLPALARARLPAPRDWADLADPVYAGQIAMPVPGSVGFAPVITEIVLQSQGWTRGWALLARIAANAALLGERGSDLLDPVKSGQTAIGLSIDFFAAQAILKGAPLRFVYPRANAFEPAQIAIPADAPAPEEALAYVRFVLSEAGQKLLVDPDLRRLAVRPSVYAGMPADYYNPWAEEAQLPPFDTDRMVVRRDLDNALFGRLIVVPRARTAPLWAEIRRLGAHPGLPPNARARLDSAEAHLTAVPLDEHAAGALASAFVGTGRKGATPHPAAATAMAAWDARIDADIDAATHAIAEASTLTRGA
jgi:phosphoglycerate transport regulatory protein PgtC